MAVIMNEPLPVIADGRCRSEGTAGTSGVATRVVLPGVHWGRLLLHGVVSFSNPGWWRRLQRADPRAGRRSP